MPTTLIKNISSIIGITMQPLPLKQGAAMSVVEQIDIAYILVEGETIKAFGPMSEMPLRADIIIDANHGSVMPSWCDSHTHIVFASPRDQEYVARLRGATYEDIAKAGGGILNSAIKLADKSEDDLYYSAKTRLESVIACGTGAIEIKSGYGLTIDSEIKMLKVIRRLKESSNATIKSTFLGAHAVPTIFKENRNVYIDLIINQMIPMVAGEGLADYCDVFCDKGFFTVAETDLILKAADKYSLKAKIHANELANSGGVQVGIANNAVSVDHLECIEQEEIDALLASQTIPTVLPSCSYFIQIPYAPARRMIDAGLGIAMATDFNPGTSPSGNVPLLMSIACNHMRILPTEAFNAVTINGAHAMELGDTHGTIAVGMTANLIITKPNTTLDYMVYAFGTNHIDRVMLKGVIV